jgi:hypothetical protein
MVVQTNVLPPSLEKLRTTPVLASEMPPGFTRVKVVVLPGVARVHLLGGIRLDFSNARTTESESFAFLQTPAAALALAKTAAKVNGGSLFSAKTAVVGRFMIAATAATRAGASALLQLALAHFHRAEG